MKHVGRTPLRDRHPVKLCLVQVACVKRISPRMRRITSAGDELAGFTSAAADDHAKLFFPAPGQDRPSLPSPGSNGREYPAGPIQPAIRNDTPRRFDPQPELVIEFVIHGDGPASTWAAQASRGSGSAWADHAGRS